MSYMARRVSNFSPTIFFEMTNLANQYQAINLGQGFPDFSGPDFLKQAAIQAIQGDINQYAPGSGGSICARLLPKKWPATTAPALFIAILPMGPNWPASPSAKPGLPWKKPPDD